MTDSEMQAAATVIAGGVKAAMMEAYRMGVSEAREIVLAELASQANHCQSINTGAVDALREVAADINRLRPDPA